MAKRSTSTIRNIEAIQADLNRRFHSFDRRIDRVTKEHLEIQRQHEKFQRKFESDSIDRIPITNPSVADTTVQSADQMKHMGKTWNDELIVDPTGVIFTSPDSDLSQSGICAKCIGFRTKDAIEPLPAGWNEYITEETQQVYYFHYSSGDISWSPPSGCARASLVVFQQHGSVFQICRCHLERSKRLRILRELREKSNEIQIAKTKEQLIRMQDSMATPTTVLQTF